MTIGQTKGSDKIYYTLKNGGNPEWYGDYEDYKGTQIPKKELFVLPDHFQGSDYSGSLMNRANHNAFLRKFGRLKGIHDVRGGMGTYAVAIRADLAESNKKIAEVLSSLEGYPMMDEETYRELETLAQNAAMKDVVDSLHCGMNLDGLVPKKFLTNRRIEMHAWLGIEALNLDWSLECDCAWIDFREIQPYVEDMLLLDHCKKLPLLISREWCCTQTKNLFEQKIRCTK